MSSQTIVMLPDPHTDLANISVWNAECQWIADNKVSQNIAAVVSIGDSISITNPGDPPNDLTKMQACKAGYDTIDATGLPYVICTGNHDYDDGLGYTNHVATIWDSVFPLSRFSGKSWYGASYDTTGENIYIKFQTSSLTFLIFSLEFSPRAGVLTWAHNIALSNPDLLIIVATHDYLLANGTVDTTTVWNTFKDIPDVCLIMGGHNSVTLGQPTSVTRTDNNDIGISIAQLFLNFQSLGATAGKDTIGILTFNEDTNQINIKTFSPYLDKYGQSYNLPFSVKLKINNDSVYQSTVSSMRATKPRDTSGRKILVRG